MKKNTRHYLNNFFDTTNKVIILLALILATVSPTIAAEQPADYCDDQVSWLQ